MSRSNAMVGVLLMVSACAQPKPAPVPDLPRNIGTQQQAIVGDGPGVYALNFAGTGDGAMLPVMANDFRLAVRKGDDGELVVDLSAHGFTVTGVADELDDKRWMVGLAGTLPGTDVPLVMHMTATHDAEHVRGTVVIDAGGQSYSATFVASRSGMALPAVARPTDAPETHYHLPDGVR